MDSQLRPRMYKSKEQFEKSFPAWRDGKAELIEYAPTLTPPNEPLTCEGCMYIDEYFGPCAHCMRARGYVDRYRRLPEGEAK